MSSNEDIHLLEKMARAAKSSAASLKTVTTSQKNSVLLYLAELLDENRAEIRNINSEDVENSENEGLSPALLERLTITDKTIDGMIQSVLEIAALKDPVGGIIDGYTLPNGLKLQKTRVPIGVLAVIYESRPNVTIDVGALGLKSSNAVILRGGKEALQSNKFLTGLFQKALTRFKLPSDAVALIEKTDRKLIEPLVKMSNFIDIIVPRGGEALIRTVSEHATIPVIKHDKGVCHIFIDEHFDFQKSLDIVMNSKTQRPSVCNALESLLIHKNWPHTEPLLKALTDAGVTLHGDTMTIDNVKAEYSKIGIEPLLEEGYGQEYLSLDLSVKFVESTDDAIRHIQKYSSGHTEAILSDNYSHIESFCNSLDSAALLVNCSTRFHDGGQFGLGAEVGIATGKLHVRGPMGLNDLTTMQYIVQGTGQIRT